MEHNVRHTYHLSKAINFENRSGENEFAEHSQHDIETIRRLSNNPSSIKQYCMYKVFIMFKQNQRKIKYDSSPYVFCNFIITECENQYDFVNCIGYSKKKRVMRMYISSSLTLFESKRTKHVYYLFNINPIDNKIINNSINAFHERFYRGRVIRLADNISAIEV